MERFNHYRAGVKSWTSFSTLFVNWGGSSRLSSSVLLQYIRSSWESWSAPSLLWKWITLCDFYWNSFSSGYSMSR